MSPDKLVKLGVEEASRLVQNYVNSLAERGTSIRYVNASLAFLKTFFRVNGFKESRSLVVERHYQPPRYRKTGEYIPTSAEIYDMSLAYDGVPSFSLPTKVSVLAMTLSSISLVALTFARMYEMTWALLNLTIAPATC